MLPKRKISAQLVDQVIKAVTNLREKHGSTAASILKYTKLFVRRSARINPPSSNLALQVLNALHHAEKDGVLIRHGKKYKLQLRKYDKPTQQTSNDSKYGTGENPTTSYSSTSNLLGSNLLCSCNLQNTHINQQNERSVKNPVGKRSPNQRRRYCQFNDILGATKMSTKNTLVEPEPELHSQIGNPKRRREYCRSTDIVGTTEISTEDSVVAKSAPELCCEVKNEFVCKCELELEPSCILHQKSAEETSPALLVEPQPRRSKRQRKLLPSKELDMEAEKLAFDFDCMKTLCKVETPSCSFST